MSEEMIVVDNDWTSPFEVITNEYSTIESVAKVGFLFYPNQVTVNNWSDAKTKDIVYLSKVPDNEGVFYLDNSSYSISEKVNNLVLVDSEDNLIGSRHFSVLINIGILKQLYVYINAFVTYKEQSQSGFTVSFADHIEDEITKGIDAPGVHERVFNYATSRSNVINAYSKIRDISPITQQVTSYDSSSDKLQFVKDIPQFFNGIGSKYSYYTWYYLDKPTIQQKVRQYISDFTLGNAYLGFNDRIGSFLYYYYFNNNYVVMVIVGSNGYNKIDIYIAKNSLGLTDKHLLYRLKVNKWYDRLYFVLPTYTGNTFVGTNAYTIYPLDHATPVTTSHSMTAGSSNLPYTVNVYSSSKLGIDLFLDDYNSLYMYEFSDIGDLLVNLSQDSDKGYFSTTYVNIFNQASDTSHATSNSVWDYHLLNTFDIDDRDKITSPRSFYETSSEQLKYLLNNNYSIYYLGSEYSVGYNKYYDNYLILFKDYKVERIRRRLDNTFRFFAGSYLMFNDHVESIYGHDIEDNTIFFGTLPQDILVYDRGVTVVSAGQLGAYRK